MTISAVQVKMARAALGWGVRDLAATAEVSVDTVTRLERGEELLPRTLAAIRAALETAGAEFIAEGGTSAGGGAGVRIKERPTLIPQAGISQGGGGQRDGAEVNLEQEPPAQKLLEQARMMQKSGTSAGGITMLVMRSPLVSGDKAATRQGHVTIPATDGEWWINYDSEIDEWSLDREPRFR